MEKPKGNNSETSLKTEEEALYQQLLKKMPELTREEFKKRRDEILTDKSEANPAKVGFSEVNGVVQLEKESLDEVKEQDPHN